ncbi:MAG TPA: PH domain-containing protein [Phycisphaerae bacterium]|nr:PH domain-containing protein [Phycisphaerae bacterium]
MSPSAEPTSEAQAVGYLVPANLLGDSEIIVLAIKPSGWFVLTASAPVLFAAAVAAAVAVAIGWLRPFPPQQAIVSFCAAAAFGRVVIACWQWIGRTYVLTNLRVIAVRGLISPQVQAAGLTDVQKVSLSPTVAERVVGIGTVYCLGSPEAGEGLAWNGVARPREVAETIDQAVRRARGRGRNGT